MDWYSYYKERFGWGHNPYQSVAMCQRLVMELLDNHLIPFRISAESAIGYLAALYDAAGDCFSVSFPYRVAMNALEGAIERAHEVIERKDREWAQEIMEADMRADGNGPPYEPPDDYEVTDYDLDGEEMDGIDNEPCLEEMYGSDGEAGTTGTRRPFPDWQHISDWTQTDWFKLQTYKSKVLAAAEAGFMGVSAVAGVLSAAKGAMTEIPLPRQVELAMWATEVVDGLIFSMEDDLQRMCAGSLHSHAGRLVQKRMRSVTPEDTEK